MSWVCTYRIWSYFLTALELDPHSSEAFICIVYVRMYVLQVLVPTRLLAMLELQLALLVLHLVLLVRSNGQLPVLNIRGSFYTIA